MKLLHRLKNQKITNYQTMVFVIVLFSFDVLFLTTRQMKIIVTPQLPVYSLAVLAQYDGSDPAMPVFLAMDGLVYDVSKGRDAYYAPGKPYHMLAGIDASALLHIAGGDIIAKKYPIVGRIVK